MSFDALGLSPELQQAVTEAGYSDPTPIQAQTIPAVLMGRDVIGVAQTGTGKTAAFVLPMIDILGSGRARARMPRSLIIAPTRELAQQVSENFVKYGRNHKLRMALLIGGVAFGDQDAALQQGVDVLIVTPGRFLDQYERGKILLTGVEILVIDEADRMLDMGFIPDVERICSVLPAKRQTLLFSATMAAPIKKLADRFLREPKLIEVSRAASTNANIEQALVSVGSRGKREALRRLLADDGATTTIVFANRKTAVRELYDVLKREGMRVGQIHGDMEQADRVRELDRFRRDEISVLVASDVAARGLDIKGVTTIVNYDVPHHADDYVHRIGRTGRAGATGKAFTLVTDEDAEKVADIEKLIGQKIPRQGAAAAMVDEPVAAPAGLGRGAGRDGDARANAPRGRGRAVGSEASRDESVRAEAPRAQARLSSADGPARTMSPPLEGVSHAARRRRESGRAAEGVVRGRDDGRGVEQDGARARDDGREVARDGERARSGAREAARDGERARSGAREAARDGERARGARETERQRERERDIDVRDERPTRPAARDRAVSGVTAADAREWDGPVPAFLGLSARAA